MRVLGRIVMVLFAIEAFILGFGSLSLFTGGARAHHYIAHSGLFKWIFLYGFVAGVLAGAAAILHSRPNKWERRIGILASILTIPIIPIFTIVGILGLIYYLRRKVEPAAAKPPIPEGDGTSSWTSILFHGLSWVGYWYVYGFLRKLALRNGMPRPHLGEAEDWALIFAAIYFSSFVHECGHWLAGWSVRFQLKGFRLGMFHCQYRDGRWHMKFVPQQILGAHVAMVPQSPEQLRERAMTMIAGGPIGSLFLGTVAVLAILVGTGPHSSPALGVFLVMLAAMGLCDSVLNLIPVRVAVNYSDGAQLWQLWRRGAWAEYLCAIFYTGLSRTTLLRPRDWPTDMIQHAAEFARPLPSGPGVMGLAYAHFEDRGDAETAARYIAEACNLTKAGSAQLQALAIDYAYVEAFHRRDLAAARLWMERGWKKTDTTEYWRNLAAIHTLEGDFARARAAWEQGWALAVKLPATGIYDLERSQLKAIEAWLDASLRGQSEVEQGAGFEEAGSPAARDEVVEVSR